MFEVGKVVLAVLLIIGAILLWKKAPGYHRFCFIAWAAAVLLIVWPSILFKWPAVCLIALALLVGVLPWPDFELKFAQVTLVFIVLLAVLAPSEIVYQGFGLPKITATDAAYDKPIVIRIKAEIPGLALLKRLEAHINSEPTPTVTPE